MGFSRTNRSFGAKLLGVGLGILFWSADGGIALGAAASDSSLQRIAAAIEHDEQQRTPQDQKISSELLQVLRVSEGKPAVDGLPSVHPAAASSDGNVRIILHGQITDALQAFIAGQGGTAVVALPQYGILSATLPLARIEAIAARPEPTSIALAQPPIVNQADGLENGDGYVAHDARLAQFRYSVTGKNITVCVISDSVDHLADAQAKGWLGQVDVLPGQSNINANPGTPGTSTYQPGHTGEGTAMLELIHSLAPDARLKFATSFPDSTAMIANITAFTAGYYGGQTGSPICQIIVDDITYPTEPPFQDGAAGTVAKAVADASARGVLYITSAGNLGNLASSFSGTWEGDYGPGTADPASGLVVQQYPNGAEANTIEFVTNPTVKPGTQEAYLWWDDPAGHATNQYYLLIEDAQGNGVGVGNTAINGNDDPIQQATVPPNAKYAVIFKAANAQPRFLHLMVSGGAKLAIATAGSVFGHNASGAANALSIGAVTAQNRTTPFAANAGLKVEAWSSDGSRKLFYAADGSQFTTSLLASGGRVLNKPDLVAADCVNTDITGPPEAIKPFCGSSAAAAETAGIAALLMSRPANPSNPKPYLSLAEIRQALVNTAIPLEGPGWHPTSGYGIVMPTPALASVQQRLGYTP